MSLLKADTIKPVTSGGDLSLQGDSGGSAVDCLNITSAGDINFTGNTDAKIKLPSAGGLYESDGSTAVLTESGGAVTLNNVTLGSSVVLPTGSIINLAKSSALAAGSNIATTSTSATASGLTVSTAAVGSGNYNRITFSTAGILSSGDSFINLYANKNSAGIANLGFFKNNQGGANSYSSTFVWYDTAGLEAGTNVYEIYYYGTSGVSYTLLVAGRSYTLTVEELKG